MAESPLVVVDNRKGALGCALQKHLKSLGLKAVTPRLGPTITKSNMKAWCPCLYFVSFTLGPLLISVQGHVNHSSRHIGTGTKLKVTGVSYCQLHTLPSPRPCA